MSYSIYLFSSGIYSYIESFLLFLIGILFSTAKCNISSQKHDFHNKKHEKNLQTKMCEREHFAIIYRYPISPAVLNVLTTKIYNKISKLYYISLNSSSFIHIYTKWDSI